MKRTILFVTILVFLMTLIMPASAELGLLGSITDLMQDINEYKIRGYLDWGMTKDEVYNGLKNEMYDGKNACTEIEVIKDSKNTLQTYIIGKTILGRFTPLIICSISDVWGLYKIEYDFANKSLLSEEQYRNWVNLTDDNLLYLYETIEKTMNYIYGFGNRTLDKWEQRIELKNNYYIIKTLWTKGDTSILLYTYKADNIWNLELEYSSRDKDEYEKRLGQDLEITGIEMFYGF